LDDEIDLRPYVAALLKNWYWILGSGMAAAIIALIISSLLPLTYEATALVAITRPRYVLQFDSRFQNVSNIQPVYRAYPELATSDSVLQELRETHSGAIDIPSLTNLRQALSASAGADPSLIRLSAKGGDPQTVTALANDWADIYIQRANELFGNQSIEQVAFFEGQLALAAQDLDAAQQAMIAFQGQNRSVILETQLLSYAEAQAAYLARRQALNLLLEDVNGLKRQLAAQPGSQPVTAANQLTALLLQLKAFDVGETALLQLQLDGQSTGAPLSAGEQQAALEGLADVLAETAVQINQELANLEPQTLQAQAELQQLTAAQDRLQRDLTIAQETYTTLSRKLEEARLTTEGVGSEVQLASYAAVPERPVERRRLVIITLSFILFGALSSSIVIGSEWWRNNQFKTHEG
jgi:polysaccharide biosynthesis transport protein